MQYILRTTTSRKGFALSIVLWIVVALFFGIATLATLSKQTLVLTKGVKEKLQTQLMAQDVLESFKFYAMTASYGTNELSSDLLWSFLYKFPKKIVVDGRWYALSKDINISIMDTSGLINANYSLAKDSAFMLSSKDQRQLRYTIEDSLKDWKDKDNVVSLNGAENAKYTLQKGVKYKVRNNPSIQSVEELRLINGIDTLSKERWKTLKNNFYYANNSMVNLAIVPDEYLSYILKLNSIEAEILLRTRKKNIKKFVSTVSNIKIFNDERMGFYLSRSYRISIVVTAKNARSILSTLIDFRKTSKKNYTVIEYKLL